MGGGRRRGQGNGQAAEMPLADTGEQIYISSLALLKMLKHARSGIPFEVMGLMVGEIHDDYTITVVDVFSMPQKGTTVSVESVDPVFQQQFMDMMKQVGRDQVCVGWYHSHPGFGPWLSGTDVETQKSQEMLNPRAVAVVVDPVQSVKGKVVIDAFRNIDPQILMMGMEPRQTTSNIGHIQKPSLVAIAHGLGKYYYSIALNYRKNEFEQKMLMNLNKVNWGNALKNRDFLHHQAEVEASLKSMAKLTGEYNKWIQEENKKTKEEFVVSSVGKMNPKNHLSSGIEETLNENVMECLGAMINTVVF